MTEKTVDYSKTVLLPKTAFPMKAELPKKEPGILEFWKKINLYEKMLEARKDKPRYILHDGPPYANGRIHIGHALNKVLKDIVVKSMAMTGHHTPYVPGWDCHGLPIEQQLLKELKIGKRHVEDVPEFRKKAREFAQKFIDLQREEFKRLGVVGEWDNPYRTMSREYEGAVVGAFRKLLAKGYIYRGKKTVYWCVSCETALADAEVEYKDKNSDSIYVRFRIVDPKPSLFGEAAISQKPVSLVIWTTTPWTLPANMAAAVSKAEDYRILEAGNEYFVTADKLSDSFMEECGLSCKKGALLNGEKLAGLEYEHCLKNYAAPGWGKNRRVIHTDFVAMDTGTGIVHIAPGHGEDDFYAGKDNGLDIFCPVNEQGKYTKDAGTFEGLSVFEANGKVIEALKESGNLAGAKTISHSYPHCWRCKQPIVFRATEQWFLGVDYRELRTDLLRAAEKVQWVPPAGRERMSAMLELRPDWCLSRQRYWGTPIPILYCKSCNKPQTDDSLLEIAEKRAYQEGTDFWFIDGPEKLVPEGYRCSCGGTGFIKEKDILDVWMDSGVSWLAVLKAKEAQPFSRNCDDIAGKRAGQATEELTIKHPPLATSVRWYPADLYLEGSDQHRGWFQTSMIPSVALEGKAPYHTVLTHGFVLDDQGKAMHKSAGNVVSPQEVVDKYGADLLRLWVALSDYSDDVRLSSKLLDGPIDTYRKIRNTIRYLLGNIWDYEPQAHRVPDEKLLEMDRYMRHRLSELVESVTRDYNSFRFRPAIRSIADFCILDLSAFYLDALKDRLYTLGKNSVERRSCQTVLCDITISILKLMSPVLSFTAEEAWQLLRDEGSGMTAEGKKTGIAESVFLEDFPLPRPDRRDDKLARRWTKIRELKEKVLKALEEARQNGMIGSSLEARVTFRTADPELQKFLADTINLWPSIAIISDCGLEMVGTHAGTEKEELKVLVSHAEGAKCPRCWQWKTDVGSDAGHPHLCARCASVVANE